MNVMPIFKIRLEREYVNREVLDLDIEADDEAAARVELAALIADDLVDVEDDWSEVDGGPGEVTITSITETSKSNDVIITS